MKTITRSLLVALLVMSVVTTGSRASVEQIEITEIKNVGVSAMKETHSIIQVSWASDGESQLKHVSFELSLEVIYADGFVEKSQAKAAGGARSARFEVPTVHRSGNQPAAEVRSVKASITANYSATTTKQVSP